MTQRRDWNAPNFSKWFRNCKKSSSRCPPSNVVVVVDNPSRMQLQIEMLKEGLHAEVSKSVSLLGGASSAIKSISR